MKSLFCSAQVRFTMMASKVGRPFFAMAPAEVSTVPSFFTRARTGSQMKVASMSPRSQAAAIYGGRMFSTCTSRGFTPASDSAKSSW